MIIFAIIHNNLIVSIAWCLFVLMTGEIVNKNVVAMLVYLIAILDESMIKIPYNNIFTVYRSLTNRVRFNKTLIGHYYSST